MDNNDKYKLYLITEAIKNKEYNLFDYILKDNNVEKYIKDKDYIKLDLNDEKIKNLYKNVKGISIPILESYVENKITNDTIITLTLDKISDKIDDLKCKEYEDGLGSICDIDTNVFDKYAKQIFGNSVKYSIKDYKEIANGCHSYYYENEKLHIDIGSGCDVPEDIDSDILLAYQKDDKIVIIEKALYIREHDSGWEPKPSYAEKFGLNVGIYNNLTDKYYITSNVNCDYNNDNYLDMYFPFLTYYSYIFTKGNDGNYYYTDFAKLN